MTVYYQIITDWDDAAIQLRPTWSTTLDDLFPLVSSKLTRLYFEDIVLGDEDRDVLWSMGEIMIINDRVLELFKSAALTGWVAIPVTILRCKANLGERYALRVDGEVVGFDYSLSVPDSSSASSLPDRPRRIGLLFFKGEEPTTDFINTHYGIMVSERVRQLMLQQKVTGVRFVQQTDAGNYGIPDGVAM